MTRPSPTPARLRHGLASVPVHLIAEQLYCERKVELALDFPDVERPTAEIEVGAAGHAALAAEAEPIAPADLEALVEAGEAVRLHEYRLRGVVDGVPIAGRPDAVFLSGRAADLVLEFKFSAWRRPFPSHRLQLLAYGLLLGQNGYDVARLVCGVLMFPTPTAGAPDTRSGPAEPGLRSTGAPPRTPRPEAHPPHRRLSPPGATTAALRETDYAVCAAHASSLAARRTPGGPAVTAAPEAVAGGTLSLFPYDAAEAARRLGWAVTFWQGRRPARLADNPSKCRRCAFMEAKLCGGTRTR